MAEQKWQLAIIRPGPQYNVLDPSQPRSNFVFHSDNNTYKIARILQFDNSGAQQQAHGLTYPPTVIFYRELESGKWFGGNDGYNLGGGSTISVDSTNVYYDGGASFRYGDCPCYCFVLFDPLNAT